jgi:xanthine dehydrogenase accessory factor
MQRFPERPLAIVVGATDVGSATAVGLHRAGYGVVLCEDVDPAWPRRGMAFTNAWYVGSAELDGIAAVFCSSVRSIPTVLLRGELIAATTWSWAGVAATLPPVVVAHTRSRERLSDDLRAEDPNERVTIGVGPGFVAGGNVDIVVESAPGPSLGGLVHRGPALPRSDAVPDLGGVGRERFVHAPAGGRFMTQKRIGAAVAKGEIVGVIGIAPVAAPLAGVLRGLTARGARVAPGTRIVEIDPRGESALCFGIGDRPRMIAQGVLAALACREILTQPSLPSARPPRVLTA